jgi:hypothetical protein
MEKETVAIDWKEAYEKKLHYVVSLERNRSDLMGVNQELRDKIASLERGQEDLLCLGVVCADLELENERLRSSLERLEARGRMHVDDKQFIRETLTQ